MIISKKNSTLFFELFSVGPAMNLRYMVFWNFINSRYHYIIDSFIETSRNRHFLLGWIQSGNKVVHAQKV